MIETDLTLGELQQIERNVQHAIDRCSATHQSMDDLHELLRKTRARIGMLSDE